jgi:predicted RNA binding protein YcfA (HicA-like mRNA interferase family)
MPRKKREVKRDLRRAGFVLDPRRGKGSHSWWYHPRFPDIIVSIAGHDGDDAKPYDEDNAAKAIAEAERRLGLS